MSFLWKESVSKINKINLLNQLSVYINKSLTLKADIEDLQNDVNEKYLPIKVKKLLIKILA